MSSNNIRQLVDRLDLLETRRTSDLSLGQFSYFFNPVTIKDRIAVLEQVAREWAEKTGTPWEKLQPLIDDAKEQMNFYVEYTTDIELYLATHPTDRYISVKETEDYIKFSHRYSDLITQGATSDILGLRNPNNRGLLLDLYRQMAMFVSTALKSRGIKI